MQIEEENSQEFLEESSGSEANGMKEEVLEYEDIWKVLNMYFEKHGKG